ncbi:quinone oxidoreductase-like protein 1 isoform X1 [Xyrauchen texanus]|uniref:quinone oxidoreductase-like protein 1 isoform X1 n=1 Tax=Xyrauchen texanus TaxID=154827 RepID=UPI0022429177|nr:quinone oxidoreductase-like protein 1 isoform X1 [Xyrauchen texanus]XP_051992881.1 quinone oxidoreductase-like protein 1 isoform X1 [Xyrauchen texanus]XP_051992883.1 quinone oxidoreductase-like protein 1 isoform X1 [Xyrauchen texanus]
MKGLYCKLSGDQGDVKFLLQETILPTNIGDHQVKVQVKSCALSPVEFKLYEDLKLGMEQYPVGREIAGVVLQVGPKVTFFQPDDEVVGILPLDVELSGLCSIVLVDEYNLVQKPEKVSWFDAVAAIKDGLRAYTALHTLARMAAGQTLLVLDGASPFGVVAIQLAHYHGVKVMATALSPEDQKFLEELRPCVGVQESLLARVIKVWDSKEDLVESCLEETGGLGLDIIVDSGVRLYEEELEALMYLPHKHDLITLLAVGGHWVTTEQNLQLDPPDSHILFLKAASVSFLNEEVWAASRAKQGRYLHIMKDVVDKLSTGTFRPLLEDPVPLYEATVSMEMVQRKQVRKRIVIKL